MKAGGDPPGEYRLDLVDGYFLMFCAVDLKMPINDKNKVDWTKVGRPAIFFSGKWSL
jgi:hypothetical protein